MILEKHHDELKERLDGFEKAGQKCLLKVFIFGGIMLFLPVITSVVWHEKQ
jgi:hypothetical protein